LKKIVALAVASLLVLGAVSVMAAETTFEGAFRVRSWSEWNFDKKITDRDEAQYDGWFEQRFRLTITHTRSEYLKAVVMLDIAEDTWGQGRALRINASNAGSLINWAYLEFTLPGIGNFRVGQFPFTLGHGWNIGFFFVDGIEYTNSWGPVSLTLLYAKMGDAVSLGPAHPDYNRDTDLYALNIGITPAENHTIDLYFAFANDPAAAFGILYLMGGGWWGFAGADDVDAYTVGIAYTGNFADMIDIMFEASYLWGDTERPDYDVEGWSVWLDVSYYNELFRVGGAFLFRSGGDAGDIGDTLILCGMQDDSSPGWGNIIGNWGGGRNSIYGGAWYMYGYSLENIISAKLYFEICPVEKLTIYANVIWAQFAEDVGVGDYYRHPADYYGNFTPAYSITSDNDLGWEIDFGFSYEIMEGLTYSFDAGVLFTGDAWDYNAAAAAPNRESWGEIWSIRNTITYSF
jgi:hypothetical protein